MNLSDLLPIIRNYKINLETQIALTENLGGVSAIQTSEIAGATVATIADILQRVIDKEIIATESEDTELREIYDNVLEMRETFESRSI